MSFDCYANALVVGSPQPQRCQNHVSSRLLITMGRKREPSDPNSDSLPKDKKMKGQGQHQSITDLLMRGSTASARPDSAFPEFCQWKKRVISESRSLYSQRSDSWMEALYNRAKECADHPLAGQFIQQHGKPGKTPWMWNPKDQCDKFETYLASLGDSLEGNGGRLQIKQEPLNDGATTMSVKKDPTDQVKMEIEQQQDAADEAATLLTTPSNLPDTQADPVAAPTASAGGIPSDSVKKNSDGMASSSQAEVEGSQMQQVPSTSASPAPERSIDMSSGSQADVEKGQMQQVPSTVAASPSASPAPEKPTDMPSGSQADVEKGQMPSPSQAEVENGQMMRVPSPVASPFASLPPEMPTCSQDDAAGEKGQVHEEASLAPASPPALPPGENNEGGESENEQRSESPPEPPQPLLPGQVYDGESGHPVSSATRVGQDKVQECKSHPLFQKYIAQLLSDQDVCLSYAELGIEWGDTQGDPDADVEDFECWLQNERPEVRMNALVQKADLAIASDMALASADRNGFSMPPDLRDAYEKEVDVPEETNGPTKRKAIPFPKNTISCTPLTNSLADIAEGA